MESRHYRPNRCAYCGTQINAHQVIQPGHCGDPECATRHAVKGHNTVKRVKRDTYATHIKAARRAPELSQLLSKLGAGATSEISLLTVPFGGQPLVPVEHERMEAFKAHLSQVISEAFEVSDEEVAAYNPRRNAEPEEPVLAAGCATCQGHCCQQGNKSKAFLGVSTMKGHRKFWPDLTAEVMEANYLAALPELAYEGGCVYQGDMGCTLPREMRSDICNTFHCHELEFSEERAKAHPDRPIALVAVDDDGIPRNFATLTEDEGWQKL